MYVPLPPLITRHDWDITGWGRLTLRWLNGAWHLSIS
jgi:hypothetical protein